MIHPLPAIPSPGGPCAEAWPQDTGTRSTVAATLLDDLRHRVGRRRLLLVGVGNSFCGDDGVGSLLAQRLAARIPDQVLDVSDVPENYIVPIQESGAEVVLVVDALDFGARPGDLTLLDLGDLQARNLFSHNAGLGLVFKAIEPPRRPDVFVVGIQPASILPGRSLSPIVQASLQALEQLLLDLFAGTEPSEVAYPPSR